MRKLWVLLLLMTISFIAHYTFASTEVGGNISEDTTWTLAGSPYIVTQNLSVYSKLVIEPGVVVKFNKGTKIIVGNELIAIGNSDELIHFLSNEALPAIGDWGGIEFIDGAIDTSLDIHNTYIEGCIIKYCKIEHAMTAISFDEN